MTDRPRVAIIEDIEMNRDLLEQILEDRAEIRCASDGGAGLELVRTWRPDLVLLDLSLPVVDGWTVARRIRETPELAATLIVALTAHAMAGDRERALEAGCDEHLPKPVDEAALFALVAESLSRRCAG